MKIKGVKIEELGRKVRLTARCKIRKVGWDTVYFEFDKKYKHWIIEDASPFAAALLVPAMKMGEDLEIDGTVSEKLFDGMKEMVGIMSKWQDDWHNIGFSDIEIKAKEVIKDAGKPRVVALFFSGGVDSFYSYLKHRKGRDRITHFVLVNGADIDLRNKRLWRSTLKNVSAVAREEGIELIEVETNIKDLVEPIMPWEYSSGGGLPALVLALRAGIRKAYISSSYSAAQQFPAGSTLETDHLWSTENLEFVHDGTEARRIDKVLWEVGRSPLAWKHLRVCYKNVAGTYNCGACDKCLRTMTSLVAAGTLGRMKTFPHNIDLVKLASMYIPTDHAAVYHRENLEVLKEKEIEPELQKAIKKALSSLGPPKYSASGWVDKGLRLDHLYTKGTVRSVLRPVLGRKF